MCLFWAYMSAMMIIMQSNLIAPTIINHLIVIDISLHRMSSKRVSQVVWKNTIMRQIHKQLDLSVTKVKWSEFEQALMATADVPLENAHNWCNFPAYDSSHYTQYKQHLTDEFTITCIIRSVCSLRQYYTVLPNC